MTTMMTDQRRWDLLPESQQERLLEEHRDWNVRDFEWWDFVYESFTERLSNDYGIHVFDMRFSGFWSQGDGASFCGQVDDWIKVLRAINQPELLQWANECDWRFSSSYGDSRYCHANTMSFSEDITMDECPYDEEDEKLQYDVWHLVRPSDKDLENLESKLADLFKDLAYELYRELDDEYEHLTSDESVIDAIMNHFSDEELKQDRIDHDEEEEEEETVL